MEEEAQIQDLRRQFSLAKVTNPDDLNTAKYVWESAYNSYRNNSDAEAAYSYLELLLEISDHLIQKGKFFSEEISAMSLRLNYVERFGLEIHPELREEVIEWADNSLANFDFRAIETENENWRSLPHSRIRELGRLRNVLAFIRRHQSLRDGMKIPNLDAWLELSIRFLH